MLADNQEWIDHNRLDETLNNQGVFKKEIIIKLQLQIKIKAV